MAKDEKVAVVGGGISGLMMALEMANTGRQVTVFEETNRLGGKIQTGALGGSAINLGAEFIDSTQSSMIALVKELLGEEALIPATDQKTERFQLPDGKMISGEEFHAAYKPLAEQIIADKKNLIVGREYTKTAKHLNEISLAEYLQELAKKAENEGKEVDPKIIETVARVYASEAGRDPEKISALQFVNESSKEPGSFLNSDCGYRVKGGTEELIKALHQRLAEKGVKFATGAKLEEVSKNGAKFNLGFAGEQAEGAGQGFDKVALAVPMHDLAEIKGLEALGLKPEEREFLKNAQYTHSAKFFVKLKDGVKLEDANFFSGEGFQTWISDKGMMTVLAGGEKINSMGKDELVNHVLESYAKAHGQKVEDLFEITKESIAFGAPDTRRPCYGSPAVGQAMDFGALFGAMNRMAEHGLAIVGTYLPLRAAEGTSIGFMENGLAAATRAAKLINQPSIGQQMQNVRVAKEDEGFFHKMYTGVKETVGRFLS